MSSSEISSWCLLNESKRPPGTKFRTCQKSRLTDPAQTLRPIGESITLRTMGESIRGFREGQNLRLPNQILVARAATRFEEATSTT